MEPTTPELSTPADAPLLCSYCHYPLKPEYYFCPNCGTKAKEPPLSTSIYSQAGLYAFSAVLPVICYLAISKWKGQKYFRSADPKAQQVGAIAWAILIISSVITFYYAYSWTQGALQSAETTASSQSAESGL